ncbi:Peroxidase skpo-1 [Halotydeus destructor]|nr:Peroxidase skpo-1 [Halotydeus destructor]
MCVSLRALSVSLVTLGILGSARGHFYETPVDQIADHIALPSLTSYVLDDAFHHAKDLVVNKRKLEDQLSRDGIFTDMTKQTAVTRHQAVTTTFNRANELEKNQEVFEEMTKLLAQNMSHDPMEPSATAYALRRVPLNSPDTRRAVEQCLEAQEFKCDPYEKFRKSDGSCNNLYNPHWGKAMGCFSRLLPPDYADGLSAPRVSVTGAPLPNPRILSAVLHRDLNYPATYTHLTMQYGQFFAHDIAFTPSSRTRPREQMNQITAFIDGSMVYGSAENETRSLWTRTGPGQ